MNEVRGRLSLNSNDVGLLMKALDEMKKNVGPLTGDLSKLQIGILRERVRLCGIRIAVRETEKCR